MTRPPASVPPSASAAFASLRRSLRQSGVRQIERNLDELLLQLRDPSLSPLERAILAGRIRELRASRWLVNRLLATPNLLDPGVENEAIRASYRQVNAPNSWTDPSDWNPISPSESRPLSPSIRPDEFPPTSPLPRNWQNIPIEPPPSPTSPTPNPNPQPPTPNPQSPTLSPPRSLAALLFDTLATHLQSSLENLTDRPMETDILRSDRKRELFYLVLRKLEDLLDELRFSQVQAEVLAQKRSQLLLDLWEAAMVDFFGKYATVMVRGEPVEVVSVLLETRQEVRSQILDKIPGAVELLTHLLFQTPLLIDGVPYTAGNPEAMLRAEALLSHLVIQVANAVVQPLLDRFADVEVIKQTFYDRRLMPSREIERFRNDLSWRYRMERYFVEPTEIFESRYRLLTFHTQGIAPVSVYAPRREELEQLAGIPYAVTLALETRDAIAPRLRSAVSVLGSGVIYLLTEVIGRGIGLIGRGVLKGIGNTWQESKGRRR